MYMYHCSILQQFLCAGCLETSRYRDTGRSWTNPAHPVRRAPKWQIPFLAWQREQLGPHWLVWPWTWQPSSSVKATQSGDELGQECYGSVITKKITWIKVQTGHLHTTSLLNKHVLSGKCTIPVLYMHKTCSTSTQSGDWQLGWKIFYLEFPYSKYIQ